MKSAGLTAAKRSKGAREYCLGTLGNLIKVIIHALNMHDTTRGYDVLMAAAKKYPTLEAFSGDAGYSGTAVYKSVG